MKIFKFVGIGLLGLIIIGFGFLMLYKYDIYYDYIFIRKINVTEEKIELTAMFKGSGVFFKGYDIKYRDQTLYLQAKGSLIPLFLSRSSTSIPNKYGVIKEIYLMGKDSSQTVMIWPKNNSMRSPNSE